MENEANRKERKEKDDLCYYKEIVEHAHKQIEFVRNYYIWLLGAIVILIALGMYFIGKSFSDMRADSRSEIDIITRQVKTRIDQEFDKENLRKRIEIAAQDKVDEIAVPLISKDLNEMIVPKIQAAEKKVEDINDSITDLENRVKKADEEQRLLSKDVELLRLFFDVRRGKRNAFEKLQDIASISTGKQSELAHALLDDISLYYEDLKFKVYHKGLISKITNALYNPNAEIIYQGISDPNLPSNRRRAFINEISEQKLQYFVEELVRIVRTDSDLNVAADAAKAIQDLVNEDFSCCPPFSSELNWWEKTGKYIEKFRSPFPEIERLFNLFGNRSGHYLA